jgi:hypothetical protein
MHSFVVDLLDDRVAGGVVLGERPRRGCEESDESERRE